ncbi:hypothetical protein [Herbaspirillum rubrisubalbicans]|uniref:Uncharacterized protein n=1 Tax=Herbaspirillum rubrisubalbicans TaxID=80842 RepID=A0AAD0XFT7_9BURK|nr:hypothetical protein [Herbaspirillum rubrisubalbicans]ALU87767.1 hypothetical protein Hrubri_0546 [Herbaspirillum rubrisubalbicans M1]AYR22820.1 hypothetical protein RC54_02845 [Herbaspirillum rubrisubalbicans]
MSQQDEVGMDSHRMKICIGGTTYVIESRALDLSEGERFYEYRVWCEDQVVKDWTQGNMADFFAPGLRQG